MTPKAKKWSKFNEAAIEACAHGKAAVQPIIKDVIVHGLSEVYAPSREEVILKTPWRLCERLDKVV